MTLSISGVLVCLGLVSLGIYLRAALIVPFFASFLFGSTAIATLGFLGNSSPLIYTVFAGMLFLSIFFRRRLFRALNIVFVSSWVPYIVLALPLYAFVGSIILPRIFAGQTSAFVPSREGSGLFELPLAPVTGNMTQAAYFTLGALTFLAISVVLVERNNLKNIRLGFFTFCTFLATLGTIDILAKNLGYGDVFSAIRSANYTMHTGAAESGFSRITAAFPEASVFGSAALASLAYTFTYWRRTSSTFALLLSVFLASLLLLSTSTTAYVGAAIMTIPVLFSVGRSLYNGHLYRADLFLFALGILGLTVALSVYIYSADLLAPIVNLFESAVFNKPLSASAQERTYWNLRSLQSFFDTFGFGIGLGSSRASSWIIAVLSQLGFVGAFMMAILVIELFRAIPSTQLRSIDPEIVAIHDSVRYFAIAGLVAGSIAGGAADPGPLFFVALATVVACRDSLSDSFASARDGAELHAN